MTASYPYVLDLNAGVTASLLIYAEDYAAAQQIAAERTADLIRELSEQAQLPDNQHVIFEIEPRAAWGWEVAGSEALTPGLLTIDSCTHEDHDHEGEEAA